jgi:hypothetical protein
MSGDVERVAEALAAAVRMPHTAACPCGPFALCECPTRERALEAAQVLLAPGGVVAGMVAEERAGGYDQSRADALDEARAEVQARVEAVLADWASEPDPMARSLWLDLRAALEVKA